MNFGGVLITNDSDFHPPESWAAASACMIFAIDNTVNGVRRVQAMHLQTKLADQLIEFHKHVQEEEQKRLDIDEHHHTSPIHVDPAHLDTAVEAVIAVSIGTPWEAEFHAPIMRANIRHVLGDHFATAQHIHRMAHRVKRGLSQEGS